MKDNLYHDRVWQIHGEKEKEMKKHQEYWGMRFDNLLHGGDNTTADHVADVEEKVVKKEAK